MSKEGHQQGRKVRTYHFNSDLSLSVQPLDTEWHLGHLDVVADMHIMLMSTFWLG